MPREDMGQQSRRTLLLAFWKRRWARTLPNYFLFLLLPIPFFPQTDASLPILFQYAVFAQNLWFPIGGLFQVSWSLAVEEWFYILLPGVTTMLLVLTRRAIPSIVTAAVLLIVGCALVRLLFPTSDINRGMRMVVVYRLDAIAFGVLGAILAQLRPVLWQRLARLWPLGAIAMFVLSIVLMRHQTSLGTLGATLLFSGLPVTALPVLALATRMPVGRGILGESIGAVSRWSYSMYLSHMTIFFLLYDLPGYVDYSAPAKLAVKLVGLLLIVLVSAIVYHAFEAPLLARLSPRYVPH